jgi:soluble lytic murein transglycosylase-like protein
MIRLVVTLLAMLTACDPAHANFGACFEHAAQRRHIDVNLLLAIGHVESRYRPWEINGHTGAIGVMQIMPFHLKWLQRYGIDRIDLLDGCTNINVGAFLLADFIRMYGNTWRAVGAYGAGIAPDKEKARIEYAQLVERAYEHLINLNAGSPPGPVSRPGTPSHSARPTMVVDE